LYFLIGSIRGAYGWELLAGHPLDWRVGFEMTPNTELISLGILVLAVFALALTIETSGL
jgi:hypothetical protein